MNKREDVISHLQIIWTWAHMGSINRAEMQKVEQWMTDALELLKAQEPRVLTFGDVIACSSRKEWLWFEENAYGYIEESAMICAQIYGFVDSCIVVNVPSQTLDETIELDSENYGKTWRCWSSKPTDEQREAVPWTE